MNFNRTQLLIGASLVLLGLLFGYVLFGRQAPGSDAADLSHDHDHQLEQDMDGDAEVWTCSMHPSVRSDGPGQCPICGMDLVPASDVEHDIDAYAMTMPASAVQLAQVQTTEVRREAPVREVTLPGRVAVDERNITHITSHFPGRVEDLKVDFTGARIQRGQPMAAIYSPELVSAQRELLEALQYEERNPRMVESARERLRQWRISEEQIRQIEETGAIETELTIHSPVDGVVLSREVSHQEHVREGSVLFEVANLGRLWLVFEAYEEDLPWLREGDRVEFTARARPGHVMQAQITYIDPVVDPRTRTVRVRADVSNADGTLKPDMLVRGTVYSNGPADQLMVPASAVLWTGPRSIVYVQDRESDVPYFESREVALGDRNGEYYAISSGLQEGEHVVTNGAFKIDSEFQLADRFSMMNRPERIDIRPAGAEEDREELPAPELSDTEVPDAFRLQLTEAIEAYLEAKDALVASDHAAARRHLATLSSAVEDVDPHLLPGQAHAFWMERYDNLRAVLGEAQDADEIAELRPAFHEASETLAEAAQQFGLEGIVYQQYCPMAFGDDSGTWLSRNEEITNPYIPEDMIGCGEVIEAIGA